MYTLEMKDEDSQVSINNVDFFLLSLKIGYEKYAKNKHKSYISFETCSEVVTSRRKIFIVIR